MFTIIVELCFGGIMQFLPAFIFFLSKPVSTQATGLGLTFLVALVSGWLLYLLHFPAPYLLGSLFGVWILGSMVTPLRERMAVPRWCLKPVLIGLGVLMGAMFTPEIVGGLHRWLPTVISMLLATVLATTAGVVYLVRIRQYDRLLALLCCMPGGQSEVVAISSDLVEKDYVVALCHLVRVSLVFCLTPLMLTFVQGHEAVIASNEALAAIPGIADIELKETLQFVFVAVAGYLIARLVRLPMPHLLGSLIFSIVLHGMGLISIPRINEFVILAQVTIGGGIGARLAKVPFLTLAGYLVDALIGTLIVISVYLVIAGIISFVLDISLLNLILSFIPGGFYEVTLLALLFGFDVAFVTFHHALRILIIFFSLTPLVAWFSRSAEDETR